MTFDSAKPPRTRTEQSDSFRPNRPMLRPPSAHPELREPRRCRPQDCDGHHAAEPRCTASSSTLSANRVLSVEVWW
jgi:hypothetical protein